MFQAFDSASLFAFEVNIHCTLIFVFSQALSCSASGHPMYMGGDLCKRLFSNPSLKLTSAMNLMRNDMLLLLAVLHMAFALLLLAFPTTCTFIFGSSSAL